ncbi:Nif3-like dinuclear metal center hexameric protein [Fundicoccus culcitae]|uniref:GTP cyclohydrolase 1 type 2 homolog n=1 Tax=Fundicoccus culcitae TaxID=2969821 RepID=A0ABY5P709_9LACT|nr:Nif3-like dinuclear metal center hexameric protein [Fundicoccus culcitae]UUX34521.1 Nif3-like dinuclear metal center hexameric protein [Fundicoccus culcitae]
MTTALKQIIDVLDKLYPPALAEDYDNVGLHFGSQHAEVSKVLVSLDIRPKVVQEAIDKQVDTIIVHHPPIFKPIKRFDIDNPQINMYSQLIQNQINIFALHTNLDKATNGMNDWLAETLQLSHVVALATDPNPDNHIGRIGALQQPMPRAEVLAYIKKALDIERLTVIEKKPKTTYQTIAVVGGSGSEFAEAAALQEADIYLTGDITYHHGHDCYEYDMMTVDVGHYAEKIFIAKMAALLGQLNLEHQWSIDIIASKENTNPFQYL